MNQVKAINQRFGPFKKTEANTPTVVNSIHEEMIIYFQFEKKLKG